MDDERVRELIEQSNATDLAFLLRAKEQAKAKMGKSSTRANVAAFEEASRALASAVARVEAARSAAVGEVFKNKAEALRYLERREYKIGRTKFYRAAGGPDLPMCPDGSLLQSDVDAYAKKHLEEPLRKDDGPGATALKVEADTDLKKVQAERLRFNFDRERGRYVRTSVVEEELTLRAKAFKAGLHEFGPTLAEAVAALFGGSDKSAKALCARLGLPEADFTKVMEWAHGQTNGYLVLFRGQADGFLDAYATGHWWNDDMRRVWDKWLEDDGD
jgi:hypothetical protein